MTASELRIGNWIQSKGLTNEFREWQVTAEDIPQIEANQGHIQEYQGIPLTEEWLLKFGFIRSSHPMPTFVFDSLVIFKPHVNNNFWLLEAAHRSKRFYFVHQLQNLYFALTGTELTIRDEGKERNA